MERTPIYNIPGDEDSAAQRNWRKRFGKVQLLCPRCFSWFTLGSDFEIDSQGNVSDVVYHVCDGGEYEEDHEGWVVLPRLEGWGKL